LEQQEQQRSVVLLWLTCAVDTYGLGAETGSKQVLVERV
jgi:hypothetical protein